MDNKRRFEEAFPGSYFLEKDLQGLSNYLKEQSWYGGDEDLVQVEKPGEGNMNYVLRAITNQRSFIIKQARPYVEKYPQIDAPVERTRVESDFYRAIGTSENLGSYSPSLIHFDFQNNILVIEDLGEGSDLTSIYAKSQNLSESQLDSLIEYLNELHSIEMSDKYPSNISMRRLNHEHIFNFPFNPDNGLNLDDIENGLQACAEKFKNDDELKKKISELGEIYLSETAGVCLLHGDFYPGSWLDTRSGLKVIDPEFSFFGRPEFDLGVFLAHLFFAGHDNSIEQVINSYRPPVDFDHALLAGFTGTEILRRLIGIAQLPLDARLEEKSSLMERARKWILGGRIE